MNMFGSALSVDINPGESSSPVASASLLSTNSVNAMMRFTIRRLTAGVAVLIDGMTAC